MVWRLPYRSARDKNDEDLRKTTNDIFASKLDLTGSGGMTQANVDDHGWPYLIFSVVLSVVSSDHAKTTLRP